MKIRALLFVSIIPFSTAVAKDSSDIMCERAQRKILEGFGFQSNSMINSNVAKTLIDRKELETSFEPVVQSLVKSGGIDPKSPLQKEFKDLMKELSETKKEIEYLKDDQRLFNKEKNPEKRIQLKKGLEAKLNRLIRKEDGQQKALSQFQQKHKVVGVCQSGFCDLVKAESLKVLETFIQNSPEKTSAAISMGLIMFAGRYGAVISSADVTVSETSTEASIEMLRQASPWVGYSHSYSESTSRVDSVEIYIDSTVPSYAKELEQMAQGADIVSARSRMKAAEASFRMLMMSGMGFAGTGGFGMGIGGGFNPQDMAALVKKEHTEATSAYFDLVINKLGQSKSKVQSKPKNIKIVKEAGKIKTIDVMFSTGEYVQVPCTEDGKVDFKMFGAYSGAPSLVYEKFREIEKTGDGPKDEKGQSKGVQSGS